MSWIGDAGSRPPATRPTEHESFRAPVAPSVPPSIGTATALSGCRPVSVNQTSSELRSFDPLIETRHGSTGTMPLAGGLTTRVWPPPEGVSDLFESGMMAGGRPRTQSGRTHITVLQRGRTCGDTISDVPGLAYFCRRGRINTVVLVCRSSSLVGSSVTRFYRPGRQTAAGGVLGIHSLKNLLYSISYLNHLPVLPVAMSSYEHPPSSLKVPYVQEQVRIHSGGVIDRDRDHRDLGPTSLACRTGCKGISATSPVHQ